MPNLRCSALKPLLTVFLLVSSAGAQNPLLTTSTIYQASAPAVVLIETNETVGSGFVLEASGYIATTSAVIRGAGQLQVRTASGEVFDRVRVIAEDERRDLAVLKVAGFGLPVLRIGDSDTVEVRDDFIVLGVSVGTRGFQASVAEGTVQAIRMEPAGFRALHVQAALSEEDRGSPVLARDGTVVAIVSSPALGTRPATAIPINYLLGLLTW